MTEPNRDFNPFDRDAYLFERPEPSLFSRALSFLSEAISETPKVRGADLSHWNGAIDFKAVKASGIDFVYLKVSEHDTFKDSQFQNYWPKALEADLLVGGYHFFRGNYGGASQATNFIDSITPFLDGSGGVMLPPMLDIETRDGATNSQIINRSLAWLQTITSNLGRKPGIYSSPYLWATLMSPTPSWTTNYYGWDAHWTSAAQPILPDGWTQAMTRFWQYGIAGKHSWVAPINGVTSAEVDANWFLGTLDELKALAGYVAPPPPPPPPPDDDLLARVAALESTLAATVAVANAAANQAEVNKASITALATNLLNANQKITAVQAEVNTLKDKLALVASVNGKQDTAINVMVERVEAIETRLAKAAEALG